MVEKGEQKAVLLIEDDVLISDMLARKLSQSGFLVYQALTGEKAFALLKEGKRSDAILLDLTLPGMDGFEILRRLKIDPDFSQIPVIVLSNVTEPALMTRALEMGAVEYLVKIDAPLEKVVEKVRSVT